MAKFDYRLVENNESWTAEITRKITSKKVLVSTKKDNFKTKEEADEWGRSELKNLMSKLSERRRLLKEKN